MSSTPEAASLPPDTYPDLLLAYGTVWGCLFIAVCILMIRAWKTERKIRSFEDSARQNSR